MTLTDEQIKEIALKHSFGSYRGVLNFARALLSASIADTAGAKYTQADMERYGKCYADARDKRRADTAGAKPVAHGWRDPRTGSVALTAKAGTEGWERVPLYLATTPAPSVADEVLPGEYDNAEDCIKALRAGASEGQAVCVDCGDTIMAHDPGTCGNCHSMKYVPASAEIAALRKERDHWKANHDAQVSRARLLIERTDLPLERVRAYEELAALRERIAGMEKDAERYRKVRSMASSDMLKLSVIFIPEDFDEFVDAAIAKEQK